MSLHCIYSGALVLSTDFLKKTKKSIETWKNVEKGVLNNKVTKERRVKANYHPFSLI